jgi:acyl-ACP thioesterase
VLGKFHVKLHSRAAGWRDTVRIETWRAGIERQLFAARDYRATQGDGTLVAEATSYWAVLDLVKRRAAPIPGAIRENYPIDAERVPIGAGGFTRVAGPTRVDVTGRERHVHRSDLDTNEHVTNSAYMIWALDTIPSDRLANGAHVAELEIVFKSEALLGDAVRCEAQLDPDAAGTVGLHRLARASDGRELALARTRLLESRA